MFPTKGRRLLPNVAHFDRASSHFPRGAKTQIQRSWHRDLQRGNKRLDTHTKFTGDGSKQNDVVVWFVTNGAKQHVDGNKHPGTQYDHFGKLHGKEFGGGDLVFDFDGLCRYHEFVAVVAPHVSASFVGEYFLRGRVVSAQ